MRRLGALLLCVGLVAGCGSGDSGEMTTSTTQTVTTASTLTTSTTSSTSTAFATTSVPFVDDMPEGFEVYDGTADGFVVAFPVEWVALDLGADDFKAGLEVFGDQIPTAMADQLPAMIEQGIKLLALDPFSGNPQFSPNLNIGVYPRGPLDDFDLLEQTIPQQLKAFGAILQVMERVELSGGEAIFVEYELPIGDLGTVIGKQYFVLTETTAYVVTLTDAPDRSEEDIFDAIMRTFRPVE